ncbi:hypothetical protein [uncultured Tessaracoccus sp.]|uniref:hypothetical protein n=1 Tax=uncultured Tessaracoccus sp. TaxID=905023 RepID=UPI002638FF57|nr:hypothetical protein [uncultured Tessaracoccus sp.]
MAWKLPDEFFRRRLEPAEADEAPSEPALDSEPDGEPQPPEASVPPSRPMLIPVRIAAVLILLAGLVGFGISKALVANSSRSPKASVSPSSPASSESVTPSPSESNTSAHAAYDGATETLVPSVVTTTCTDADPSGLVDASAATGLECEGSGVGERIEFRFASVEEIVGVSLTSGNSVEPEETAGQRQVMSVRWRFSDGSWFDQGLSGSNGASQAVGFPRVRADSVTLEVVSTSASPTGDEGDKFTIGAVEFLRVG